MSDITKMDLEQHDQLARNIASELAIGDDAQVLTIIKTGLALAYKNGKESATQYPLQEHMCPSCHCEYNECRPGCHCVCHD